jgi:MraZ protein
MTFRGTFDHTLDAKNRLTIPASQRKLLADGSVVALQRDADNCLAIWAPEEFERHVAAILDGMHPLSEDYSTVERFFNAYSSDVELDSAGRVMMPAKLIAKVGLGKDVTVVGAGNRLEVWDREVWEGQEDSLVSAVKRIGPGAVGGHTS